MKKFLLLVVFCATVGLFAAESAYPVSYFQIGLWYKFPKAQMASDVYGIKSGWPMCAGQGSVTGIEASWLGSLTHHINGIQAGWTVCYCRQLNGLQATLITCINTEKLNGMQASPVFNMSGDIKGLQVSSVNCSKNMTGFQPAAILNISKNVTGVQMAPILNIADDVTGMQAGIVNTAKKGGFQLGLINVETSGFQIGLLNYNAKAWLPVFPLFNVGCAK